MSVEAKVVLVLLRTVEEDEEEVKRDERVEDTLSVSESKTTSLLVLLESPQETFLVPAGRDFMTEPQPSPSHAPLTLSTPSFTTVLLLLTGLGFTGVLLAVCGDSASTGGSKLDEERRC